VKRYSPGTFGAPTRPHRHHRTRMVLSLISALCGAAAALVAAFIIVAGVGPSRGIVAWIALPVLVVIWLTGLWWRWDSPDRRKRTSERGRRGF
jgi:hypothetical protein